MIYTRWKDLPALSAPVDAGVRCVCISEEYTTRAGTVVTVLESNSEMPWTTSEYGPKEGIAYWDLALLPGQELAATPSECTRKITQIATLSDELSNSVLGLCNDGTLWLLSGCPGREWVQLPQIPQDMKESNVQ